MAATDINHFRRIIWFADEFRDVGIELAHYGVAASGFFGGWSKSGWFSIILAAFKNRPRNSPRSIVFKDAPSAAEHTKLVCAPLILASKNADLSSALISSCTGTFCSAFLLRGLPVDG